jgi:DNA-binding response OmpR family regulator
MRSPPPAPVRAAVLVVEHDPLLGDPLVAQLAADGHAVRLARRSHDRHRPARGQPARASRAAAPPGI